MRNCVTCSQDKPLDSFRKIGRIKPTYSETCLDCLGLKHRANKLLIARKARTQKWYHENPQKVSAQRKVGYALKIGRIKKALSCQRCGCLDRKLVAHHDDYSKPLDIRWVCTPCHMIIHRELETPSYKKSEGAK